MPKKSHPIDDYLSLLGLIAVNCAEIESQTELAIRYLSLSIEEDRIQISLSEINSVKAKLRILKKIAKLVLSSSQFIRYQNILGKVESICDRRNHYLHSGWYYKTKKRPKGQRTPYLERYPRDSETPHIPKESRIRYTDLKKLETKSVTWTVKFIDFNATTIRDVTGRKHVAHIRKQSNHLKKSRGKAR